MFYLNAKINKPGKTFQGLYIKYKIITKSFNIK